MQPKLSFFSPTAPYAARRTGYYTLSPESKENALLLEHTLPLSLREKAFASANAVISRVSRENGNSASIKQNGDAWNVDISVNDMGSELLHLSMYAPSPEIAAFMKENFLSDPVLFYKGIIALLSGDISQVKALEPTPDENYN